MRRTIKKIRHHAQKQQQRLQRASKHPLALPVWIFLGLTLVATIGLIVFNRMRPEEPNADRHIVIVSHDHDKQVVPTNARTVSELLKKLHITLVAGDRVEPTPSTKIVQDNFLVNVYRAVPVTIVDNGVSTRVRSAGATPRSIVAQTGMTLYGEDNVSSGYSTNLLKDSSLGKVVTVKRATPVNLNLYGTQTLVRTQATNVDGLVAEKHIKLVDGATLNPVGKTPVTNNMQLFVLSKGVRIVSAEEVVPMPQQNIDDNNLTLGAKAVRQVGSPGKQLVTYQITVDPKTGKEVSRTAIQTVITVDPIPQIVAIGKNVNVPKDKVVIMQGAGIAASDYGYVDYVFSHESHWNPAAMNSGGCTGLGQACPGSKLAAACPNWQVDPICQTRFFTGYAVSRYGGWAGAYNAKVSKGWW